MTPPSLIFQGSIKNEANVDLQSVIVQLRQQLDQLHSYPIEEILLFFDQLVEQWQSSGLAKKNPYLKNISEFLVKQHLVTTLQTALRGKVSVLDQFEDLGDYKMIFHAQPRGLTVHWLAGNVTVLGLFSIFSALITKNVCLVKASSRGHENLVAILDTLREVKTGQINGQDFANAIAVVLVDRQDQASHQVLSENADIRIAWGGKEAVETIMQLSKSPFCEDLIFGPKYSYALIDNTSLVTKQKLLAQRLAVDVSVFDQYACSSPHTVFIEEKNEGESLAFAQELAKQLELVERAFLPKEAIDSGKAAQIISLRSEYQITGTVICSQDTKWTVIHTTEKGLADSCFSRVIFVKPVKNIDELHAYNNRQKQTLSCALSYENKLKYLDKLTLRGIDRCPDLGYATYFESPWDGMFIFDRLVRWVSTYKEAV